MCALPSDANDRHINSYEEFYIFACDDEALVYIHLIRSRVCVLADTGAQCNVIGYSVLPLPPMRKTSARIMAFGNFQLPGLGALDLEVKYGEFCKVCEFIVVDIKCRPFLSYPTCKILGILNDLATSDSRKPLHTD